jgi:hypothetical protein
VKDKDKAKDKGDPRHNADVIIGLTDVEAKVDESTSLLAPVVTIVILTI